MTTVLRKARWPVFGAGLILIAIGGFGFLIGASWASYFGSISTIFGTMMSFAQMFVAFPITTIGQSRADSNDAAASVQSQAPPAMPPNYAPQQQRQPNTPQYPGYQPPARRDESRRQYPGYTPPPPPPPGISPYPAYAVPMLMQNQPKRYKWSGIALWVGAACTLLQIYSLLTLASGSSGLQDVYDYYSIVFLQGICFLLALRGVHAKHARTAGALGVVAIMAIGGALLLSIIASGIYVGSANSATYVITANTTSLVQTFIVFDNFFIVVGDLLLGISLIYGKVYPTWIGITGIALGCIVLFEVIIPLGGTPAPVGLSILGLLLSCVQNTATGWVLFKKPQPAQAYLYR